MDTITPRGWLLNMAIEAYEKGHDNMVTETLVRISDKAPIHDVIYNEYAKVRMTVLPVIIE